MPATLEAEDLSQADALTGGGGSKAKRGRANTEGGEVGKKNSKWTVARRSSLP